MATFLIGLLAVIVGLIAVLLTVRTRARTKGKSMYASAREERARKVLAARETVLSSTALQPEIGTLTPGAAPAPDGESGPEPAPEPFAAPTPVPEPAPEPYEAPPAAAVLSTPATTLEPEPYPDAVSEPEPEPEAEPEPEPEPAPEPELPAWAPAARAAPWQAVPQRSGAQPAFEARVREPPAAAWEVVPHATPGGRPASAEPAAAATEAPAEPPARIASTLFSYLVLAASLVVILLGIFLMITLNRG